MVRAVPDRCCRAAVRILLRILHVVGPEDAWRASHHGAARLV